MRPAIVVFAVAALAQWLLPFVGVWQHERVIRQGAVVRVRCTAPDPYDPLRGRYLTVRPEETTMPKPEEMPERDAVPVWATLVADADGLSRIESLSLVPVAGPNVVQLRARVRTWDAERDTVNVQWPVQRYYLNERLAPGADRIVAERWRTGSRPVAEFRLLDGRAVLTDVLVDGVPIRDAVNKRAP
jgi:uncharacterized membrane-anchored protein